MFLYGKKIRKNWSSIRFFQDQLERSYRRMRAGNSSKNLKTLAVRRDEHCRQFFKDIQSESHVLNCLLPPKRNLRDLRTQRLYETPRGRTNRIQKSPINYGLFHYQWHFIDILYNDDLKFFTLMFFHFMSLHSFVIYMYLFYHFYDRRSF